MKRRALRDTIIPMNWMETIADWLRYLPHGPPVFQSGLDQPRPTPPNCTGNWPRSSRFRPARLSPIRYLKLHMYKLVSGRPLATNPPTTIGKSNIANASVSAHGPFSLPIRSRKGSGVNSYAQRYVTCDSSHISICFVFFSYK